MTFSRKLFLNRKKKVSVDFLNAFDDLSVSYISGLSIPEVERRLSDVRYSVSNCRTQENAVAETLRSKGLVIVDDFLNKTVLDTITDISRNIEIEIDSLLNKSESESKGLSLRDGGVQKLTYNQMASHDKPLARMRWGNDQGMIDVFNFLMCFPELEREVKNLFQQKWLMRIINQVYPNVVVNNVNLYVNSGVERTRGFHVDSFSNSLKGFVYLTDVSSLSEGPYCYVLSSNRESDVRDINIRYSELCSNNKTESPIFDLDKVVPILAPKGTLILSDQSGVHRGYPQTSDAFRKAMVARYK